MRYTHPQLLEHLASTYVLGTLRWGARRRFERLLVDRADVRLLVSQWETRLGQLAVSVPPMRPSARLWPAIAAQTQTPERPGRAHQTPGRSGFGAWLGGWRPVGFGLGGMVAGVVAASALFVLAPTLFISSEWVAMRTGERLPASYVGLLTDELGNGKVLVSSLRFGKTMSIKIIGAIAPPTAGRLVLWATPANGPAFALGTVPASGSAVSQLPQPSEKLFANVSKLSVTVETEAAPTSPHGTPVYSGNCAKLW